ncbi:MAG TPA: sugar transferase [Acidimicrobiales bacterium]|nr:sugar transferase [Acidimicrobiales bacterium]
MSTWFRLRVAFDRVAAAILLALLSPLIAGLMVAIRLNDGGPTIIAVPRVGRNGRTFGMWKLRSMRAETPDGMAKGVALTTEHDDRITPMGRRMRAWHLDELPQLFNVVRGEMCLLGARPEAPEFVDATDPRWRHVLSAPPGLAGPTQLVVSQWERRLISQSPDGSVYLTDVLPVKLAIDNWYVANSGPRLDALVAATLLRRFVPGTGSYTLRRLVRRQVPEADRIDHPTVPASAA